MDRGSGLRIIILLEEVYYEEVYDISSFIKFYFCHS